MTGPLTGDGRGNWRTGEMACTGCGYVVNALGPDARTPTGRKPENGDYSLCINCGELSIINVHPLLGAYLVEPTPRELAEFAANPAAVDAARRLRHVRTLPPG